MTRAAGETIEVRGAPGGDGPGEGGAPRAFLWRGRLFRVTGVVDHWREEAPAEIWRVVARQGGADPAVADAVFELRAEGCAPVSWSLLAARG